MGDTKLERFLLKNQYTQRKLLSFGLMANCQKVQKFDFQSQFSTSIESFESFSIFFSLMNTNLAAHFLLLTFFDTIIFKFFLLLKLLENSTKYVLP